MSPLWFEQVSIQSAIGNISTEIRSFSALWTATIELIIAKHRNANLRDEDIQLGPPRARAIGSAALRILKIKN
jgi:hypothetical protein